MLHSPTSPRSRPSLLRAGRVQDGEPALSDARVGYLIRRHVDETPVFRDKAARGELAKAPLFQVFRESWPNMLRVGTMALAAGMKLESENKNVPTGLES